MADHNGVFFFVFYGIGFNGLSNRFRLRSLVNGNEAPCRFCSSWFLLRGQYCQNSIHQIGGDLFNFNLIRDRKTALQNRRGRTHLAMSMNGESVVLERNLQISLLHSRQLEIKAESVVIVRRGRIHGQELEFNRLGSRFLGESDGQYAVLESRGDFAGIDRLFVNRKLSLVLLDDLGIVFSGGHNLDITIIQGYRDVFRLDSGEIHCKHEALFCLGDICILNAISRDCVLFFCSGLRSVLVGRGLWSMEAIDCEWCGRSHVGRK
mmetsp:Transcript_20964/g.48683  ORF Transcript_20964/g.48683 Transcript_20964/m.48683 type:complete len:264 (+) Transcript_20964:145-936(+)